jgi:hypothetical protein
MARKRQPGTEQPTHTRKPTPTFLLELPLQVSSSQAKRLRAHLEAARQFYNAVLSQGQQRLRHMRADSGGPAARAIPRTQKLERKRAFGELRRQYGFSEYALHDAAKGLNCCWIAEHVDAVVAQTLATRAYRALNRVCLGRARRVRIRRRSRGIGSLENKRHDTGLRFVLQPPEQGNAGYLLWQDDQILALIDWKDPVVTYGLAHPIKYVRLIVRQASSPRARGADRAGQRYCVQLALSGVPYQKPKHPVGSDTVGLDLGPSTLAIVPREGTPRLELRLGRAGTRCPGHSTARAPDGPAAAGQQPGPLRCAWTHQEAWEAALDVEAQQALPGDPAAQSHPPAQTRGPSQKSAWPPRP